jgi:ribonuclease HI
MKKLIIYTDGGSRGNPGKAAVGIVVCNEKEQAIKKYSEYLGDNLTNNEAEYQAIIFSLKKVKALFGKKLVQNTDIEIKCDSELAVNQLNGKYKILDEKIQPLFLDVWNLKFDFKSIKFKRINREKNKEADKLVNEAFDGYQKNQNTLI